MSAQSMFRFASAKIQKPDETTNKREERTAKSRSRPPMQHVDPPQPVVHTKAPGDFALILYASLRQLMARRLSLRCMANLLVAFVFMLACMRFMYIHAVRSIPVKQHYHYDSRGAQ